MEVYCLALLLFAHLYLREAHKADSSDVWPSDLIAAQMEPSSPMRMTAHSWGREQQGEPAARERCPKGAGRNAARLPACMSVPPGPAAPPPPPPPPCWPATRACRPPPILPSPPPPCPPPAGSHAHRAYLPSMRQHLQQHLAVQEAMVSGFGGFLGRHADLLLGLVTSPAASPGKAQPQGMVSATELDRLGFLLRYAGGGGGGGLPPASQPPCLPQEHCLPRCLCWRAAILHHLPASPTMHACRPQTAEEAEAGEGQREQPSSSGGGGSGRRKRRLPEGGGSPMDVCPTPFTGKPCLRCVWPGLRPAGQQMRPTQITIAAAGAIAAGADDSVRVSEHTPFFSPDVPTAYAPVHAVVAWLADTLKPADDTSGDHLGGPAGGRHCGRLQCGSVSFWRERGACHLAG